MSKGKVMITGASGYVGSAILLGLLRAGYTAHIAVRSEAKRDSLATAPALLAVLQEHHRTTDVDAFCTFFIVPDLTVRGSLDAATRGCDYVVHAASPVPLFECDAAEEQRAKILAPAVACTLSALESARTAGAGSVRRVVCTSSIAACVDEALLSPGYDGAAAAVNEGTLRADAEPPFPGAMEAYCASKAAALRRSLEWMEREGASVGFDLVALGPSYICGRHPLAGSTKDLWGSSNWLFMRLFAGGEKSEAPPVEVACGAHIDDVVELHLRALDRERIKTKGEGEEGAGTEFFTVSVDMLWEDVMEATRKLFPEEVEKGLLPNAGYVGSHSQVKFYSDKVEKAFGIQLQGVEEMVKSIVPQYLELLEKEK